MVKIKRILSDKYCLMHEADGALAYLWRKILRELEVDYDLWKALMNNYLAGIDYSNLSDKEVKQKRSYMRGRLTKGLTGDKMSIKTFVRGMKLMQVELMTVEAVISRKYNPVTTHKTNILYTLDTERRKHLLRYLNENPIKRKPLTRKKLSDMSDIENMLLAEDKLISKSKGALTKIWRTIIKNLNINMESWEPLMKTFIREYSPPDESKKKSNDRGNFNSDIINDNISYGIFNKGMCFLHVEKYDFIISIIRKGYVDKTVHSVLGINPSTGEFDDEPIKYLTI